MYLYILILNILNWSFYGGGDKDFLPMQHYVQFKMCKHLHTFLGSQWYVISPYRSNLQPSALSLIEQQPTGCQLCVMKII